VSALPEALPLALAAAVYPPALIVLVLFMTAPDPRRLVLAYFLGAATVTIGSGLVALAVFDGANLTARDSSSASGGVDIVFGLVLLGVAAWLRRRGVAVAARTPDEPGESAGRVATWSQRALRSRRWAVVLGLLMFLPSPLYLLAVKDIADSGGSPAGNVVAVLLCAIAVLLFVEVPLVAMLARPARAAVGIARFHDWLTRNGWNLAAALALVAGVYAIVKGVGELRG
jgi:Sap, sulfolipid-1-addressing protein